MIRRIFPAVFILVIGAITVSCSMNRPKKVAEEFCKVLYRGDFERAGELCTEKGRIALEAVKAYAGDKIELMKKADVKYEFMNELLRDDGKRATVNAVIYGSVSLVDGTIQPRKEVKIYMLKNEQGDWQVSFEYDDKS